MESESLSPNEKARIASNLLMLAPPCEFNEVFTDVRILVNDDDLLKEKVTPTFALYNKEQFHQVKLPDKNYRVLITRHGDMGNDRFLDPRSQITFHFDHLKRLASDISPADIEHKDLEPTRKAIEQKAIDYVDQHYRNGALTIYSKIKDNQPLIIICIESHYSKSFATARWRSEWTIHCKKSSDNSDIDVKGTIKIQSHLFEEGNVQLLASKEIEFTNKNSSPEQLAKEVFEKILNNESTYQEAIGENLKNISNTTFKSLRRQLPVTHNKIDWNKIVGYKIGSELFRQ